MAVLGLPLLRSTARSAATDSPEGADLKPSLPLGLCVASVSMTKQPVEEVIVALQKLKISNAALFHTHCPWDGTPEQCAAVAKKFRDGGIAVTGTGVVTLTADEAKTRQAFINCKAAGVLVMVAKPDRDALPLVDRLIKEYDLKVAVHNHGPEDKDFSSPREIWLAVRPYDPRLGMCLDVGHSARAGHDPIEVIRECHDRLLDIHMKDSLAVAGAMKDRAVVIGHGHLDIHGILAALVEFKYSHLIGFEYEEVVPDKVTGLAESVGYVRGQLASLT